jgi:hypothetical protein
MNRNQKGLVKLSLGLAAMMLAVGCMETNGEGSATTSEALNIEGSATNAALEVVTVTDAEDSVVASTATDSEGEYRVTINGSEVEFPLTITVIHDGDTLTKVVENPASLGKGRRHDLQNKGEHRDSLSARLDSLPVCADSVKEAFKTTLDSLKSELEAGVIDDSLFRECVQNVKPTDCKIKAHHRKHRLGKPSQDSTAAQDSTTATDSTITVDDVEAQ